MRPRPVLILALAAAAAALLSAPALAAKDDVVLISRATGPAGTPVNANAIEPSISASGARVAFSSDADNISDEDDNAVRNVFVRDAATNVTTLASRATGAGGVVGNGFSLNASISADARFVAFESVADNLSPDDNNSFTNIFVRDLVANTTTLVSRRTGPAGADANDNSFQPGISGDGRYVAFQSDANNLSPDDNNAFTNVFVRDLVANTTTLVSRRPGPGGAGANDNAIDATISADGNRVAFSSGANNLSNEDDDAEQNIFVRDLETATNALVSRASGAGGAPGNGESESADISSSGRFVAFRSDADNLSGEDVNTEVNIFVRDLDQSTTALASRANGPGGAGADGSSFDPVVSDNARVAFQSSGENLSDADVNGLNNVFVRDVLADTTELVSRAPGPAGAAANNSSFAPTTTPDGRYVAFESLATNLLAGTVPGVNNVYRRDVLGDAPRATPLCKTLPLPPAPPDKDDVVFTLTVSQLRINQRISQAAIRRLNAVEARLNSGLQTRDLCGYSVGPPQLGPGITSAPAAASLAPVAPADPAAIVNPGRQGRATR